MEYLLPEFDWIDKRAEELLKAEPGNSIEPTISALSRDKLDPNQIRLLSSVQLELAVEISQVKLTLAEIIELGAGAKLNLALADDLPVVISINGAPIADGRIVYQNEEAYVEVTKVRGLEA